MKFTNLHQNFILLSTHTLKQHLENRAFWPAFIAELTPFASKIKGTPRITASQFDNGKELKLGRLSWSEESLQKLADNCYRSPNPDTFYFSFLQAFFPSPVSCTKQNTTPGLSLIWQHSYGSPHSGLLLSFRQDYFDAVGTAAVQASLNRLTALLQAGLRLQKQTQYAYPSKEGFPGAWQDCVMDLFPANATEPTKSGWKINEDFAGWARF
ncbi:hypothetical protein H9Q10_07570 [Eikenella sp. S3360]|uniref:Uncharacterized protein n=1 Tax=Eikenella glucosivorans TaxID=2766967 RepID=A0ABS0NB55_9NEIS|nr:hypothetical protein [Eikenella glucosivorans]MBH5329523.1 hypothetical protein [Eikenella glucosivorans]